MHDSSFLIPQAAE